MKIQDGKILLEVFHFERLQKGLGLLKFEIPGSFSFEGVKAEIKELCLRNNCSQLARARLSVSRGRGGLYNSDSSMNYLIECHSLEKSQTGFDEQGLEIGVYPDARKSCDQFSNLKSANYIPYVMGAVWAKEHQLDEALILNHHQRICDATIHNIFWVKGNKIFTPPLSEGCVAGVMRKWILDAGNRLTGLRFSEALLTEDKILNADEIFLTNAVAGIHWVKQYRQRSFHHTVAHKIFRECILAIPV